MWRIVKVLVLSPHFDDAPLSLGQSMIDGALSGHRITVGVVFSRTDWVRWWTPDRRRWPLVTAIRRLEETATALRFGYRVRAGGLEEAILRIGRMDPAGYLSPEVDLDGPGVREVVERVTALVRRWAGDVDLVIAPLGVGDHLDHRIVAEAARRVAFGHRSGATAHDGGSAGDGGGADDGGGGRPRFAFYEDRPYAAWLSDDVPAAVAERIVEAGAPGLERRAVSGPIGRTKHRRLVYPSQLSDDFREAMAADSSGSAREHVWVPTGTDWP